MTFERYDANRPLTGELLEQALALLEASFPEEERRETPVQRRMLDGGEIGALAARNEDGTLAAVLTMWPMTDALFLEHFAVNPALRSQGLGGRILEELKKQHGKDMIGRYIDYFERQDTKMRSPEKRCTAGFWPFWRRSVKDENLRSGIKKFRKFCG